MQQKTKVVISSFIGTALEFYDFTLYGAMATVLAPLFFPALDRTTGILASLAVFAVGAFMRPFGGMVFGRIGDRLGRRRALTLSIWLMATPTVLIGCLPPYEYIGVFAPIILVACRLLQGFCTGGEYSGSAIFAMEHHEKKHRGFVGGFIASSSVMGAVTATSLVAISTSPFMPTWGWRIPFLFGIVIGGVGLYIRTKLDETPEFTNLRRERKILKAPLKEALSKYPKSVFAIFGAGWFNGVMSYTLFAYLNVLLITTRGIPIHLAAFYNWFGMVTFMISATFMGWVADKYSAEKVIGAAAIGTFFGVYGIVWILTTSDVLGIIFAQMLLGVLAGAAAGPCHLFNFKLFPTEARYSGVSFSFSLGIGIAGGITPVLSKWLLDKFQSPFAPVTWVLVSSLLGLYVMRLSWVTRMKRKAISNDSTAQTKVA